MLDIGLDILFAFLSMLLIVALPHYFGNPNYVPLTKREHLAVIISAIGIVLLLIFHQDYTMEHSMIHALYAYAAALFFIPAALISITNPKGSDGFNSGLVNLSYILYVIAAALFVIPYFS